MFITSLIERFKLLTIKQGSNLFASISELSIRWCIWQRSSLPAQTIHFNILWTFGSLLISWQSCAKLIMHWIGVSISWLMEAERMLKVRFLFFTSSSSYRWVMS